MNKKAYLELLKKSAVDGTFPSIDAGQCKYRHDDTPNCKKRCAVGLLIPDDKYCPTMEGIPCTSFSDEFKDAITMVDGLCTDDLRRIQCVHDQLAGVASWDSAQFIYKIENLGCFNDC